MKKVCVLLLVQLLVFGTVSYGAVSDDVYVRKDVFEVYMQNINSNMERILQRLDKIDDGLNALNHTVANLSGRVDVLDKRMDSLDKRIDDLRNGIYLWLVAIGLVVAIIAWPKVQDKLPKWGKATPSITFDDVRRLNNVRMAGKAQA